jgi:urease accessory protein
MSQQMNTTEQLKLLWLLQLSDSALPVGAMNQSFGLENLVAEESLNTDQLESFLNDYLVEVGGFDCLFCGAAYRLGSVAEFHAQQWLDLNLRYGACKLARESRIASATLGRRFLELAGTLSQSKKLAAALAEARQIGVDVHHCAVFGLTGAALGIEEETTLLAYLHQTLTSLISACQRLLPLGQQQATRMLWDLKPQLALLAKEVAERAIEVTEATCFTPLLEVGSMRHPTLATRLFIS